MAKKHTNDEGLLSNKTRICFERILPDEVDTERFVRRALRNEMMGVSSRLLDPSAVAHRTRMALITAKKWQKGQTIRCRFLHGSPTVQSKVEAVAHQWEKYADIKLKFVKTGDAEIRIAFANDGSWSAVGRDALNQQYFPKHQQTMNYGWLNNSTPQKEYNRVVLHEFGHALGCIHEHQSPKFDRTWNRQKVIQYFSGSPNFWSVAEIESNVLQKYSANGIQATEFDPKSIMLYMFDAALFSDNKGSTNDNSELSPHDIAFIKKLYS